jgi:hypothetical protein
MSEWDNCVVPGAEPIASDPRREIYCGVDLGLKHDATALVWLSWEGERLIDMIKQRKLIMYPSSELREAAAQAVLVESSRGLRLGKIKTGHRIDAIAALSTAVTVALQRKGYGAWRTATFGSDPAEAFAELFNVRYPRNEGDLPSFDIGFTDRFGNPLRSVVR